MYYIEYKTIRVDGKEKLNYIITSKEDLFSTVDILQNSNKVISFKISKSFKEINPIDLELSEEYFTKWF